jgi:hypothetical protein
MSVASAAFANVARDRDGFRLSAAMSPTVGTHASLHSVRAEYDVSDKRCDLVNRRRPRVNVT